MRVVLSTFGSYGDVFPYLAISAELRRRGHVPVLAAAETYRELTLRSGAEFAPLRPDIDYDDLDLFRRVMDAKKGPEYVVREVVIPHLRDSYADLEAACEGADLLLSHVLTHAAPILGAKTGMPWLSTVLSPMVFCSAHEPAALSPIPWFAHLRVLSPRVVGPLWKLMRKVSWSWSAPIRELRTELGLPADADPFWEGQHSPHGVLALFSRAIAEPQPDWPDRTTVCGFPFFDEDFGQDFRDVAEPRISVLDEFLGAGDPPVVFSLGSSAVAVADGFYVAAADAAARLGRRAVLVTGRAGVPTELPDGVIAVPSARVGPLFEASSAVVHAGGIGTTGQAMRAGRPQLIVPFAHDQFDNAFRVTDRAIGATLSHGRANGAQLAAALSRLLDDSAVLDRCARTAETVRSEAGAAAACDAMERVVAE